MEIGNEDLDFTPAVEDQFNAAEESEDQEWGAMRKAESVVNKWLDFKRVKPLTREDFKDNIRSIVRAVADGVLSVDENHALVHQLIFPIGEGEKYKVFKYKPRLSDRDKTPYMKGVSLTDGKALTYATIAALANIPRGIIAAMDAEDMRIARAIAVFFI